MKKIFISTIILCLFVTSKSFSQSTLIQPLNDELLTTKNNGMSEANFTGRYSNGTTAAPTAVSAGQALISLSGRGYNGSAFSSDRVKITMSADQAFTPTANGTRITFLTTLNGTTTTSERMRIDNTGFVGIGTTNPTTMLNLSSGNLLMETGTTDKVLVKQDGTGSAGEMLMYTNTGLKSIEIRGSDQTAAAGEINLYIPSTGVRTVEIDGDYSSSGKSRIIVDELQIKGGADLAEFFKINTLHKLEAGTVVSVSEDNTGNLLLSNKDYDKKVVGIISGANGISTGLMLHQKGNEMADGDYPIAINGRVYVKADATHQAIKPGDLLTSSAMAGYAMKASNNKKAQGAILGKALTGLDKETGMVLVLLGVK